MTLQQELHHAFAGKTVLLTGHTGFKGAWLSEWLLLLGARVVGVALEPNTSPALFDQLALAERLEHNLQDIRDREGLAGIVLETQPDYVFHLAAQPLVRLSYEEPLETYDTNVSGTVNLLDSLRLLKDSYQKQQKCCAAVFITTDKCYENREWLQAYREEDPLGGYDPYSSSKACAEIAIASWRQSFFNPQSSGAATHIGIASARAGNVMGGGDWALDRIVPDCIRHLQRGEAIAVRNPHATRPWQHVLEPLSGYLRLAMLQRAALKSDDRAAMASLCSAFNFGPAHASNRTVQAVVEEVIKHWPGQWTDQSDDDTPHEAGKLNLAWDKAFHLLGWQPRWSFETALQYTIEWYKSQWEQSRDPRARTVAEISAYAEQSPKHVD